MSQNVATPVVVAQRGVFVQQNGSVIPLRGGIYRPSPGTFIRSVDEIELLPWTKDGIVDAFMFRLCDEFVRKVTTAWETKRKAIFTMIYHSHGYVGEIGDDIIHSILTSNPYDEDNNGSMVKLWQLGDMTSDSPIARDFD